MKRAREQKTTTRHAYVQSYMWNKISLDDLRDLVAATEDYDRNSKVEMVGNKLTVTETRQSYWAEVGRHDPR